MNKKQCLIRVILGVSSCVVLSLLSAVLIWDLFLAESTPTPAESVRQFAEDPSLQLEDRGVEDYPFGQTRRLVTSGGQDRTSYEVDIETGEVRKMFHYGQQSETVEISREQARNLAVDFARSHYSDFDTLGLTLVTDQLVDHGDQADKFYSFRWVLFDADSGAILPFMVRIRVNAVTGQIASYSNLRQEVIVSTQPQIDRDRAREIAVATVAEQMPDVQAQSVSLSVTTLPREEGYSEQMLLWQVVVTGQSAEMDSTPGAVVYINAHTGTMERMAPFVGTAWPAPLAQQRRDSVYPLSESTSYRIDIYQGVRAGDAGDKFDYLANEAGYELRHYLEDQGYDCITEPRLYHDADDNFVLNNLPNDVIFMFVGHSNPLLIQLERNDGSITRLSSSQIRDLQSVNSPMPLSNLQLAIFVGCNSGRDYEEFTEEACPNGLADCGLLPATLDAGTRAAIGFANYIMPRQVKVWNSKFWDYLLNDGVSIEDAALSAAEGFAFYQFDINFDPIDGSWAEIIPALNSDTVVVRGNDGAENEPLDLGSLCASLPRLETYTANVSVEPDLACPGQVLHQDGTGFAPGQPVELTFTHERTGQTWTYTIPAENVLDDGTGNGNYIHEFTMTTDFPAGRYHYTAYQPASGRESNSVQYWLSNPQVTNPGVGWPGATVDESGTGFGPGEDVELVFTYPDGSQHTAQETTDEQGAYQHLYPIPASDEVLPGWYTYSARGLTSGCSSAPARFWITDPQVAVSQDDYVCQVSGTGFTPGEQIDVQMVRESVLTSGEADNRTLNDTTGANDAGEFTYQARLDLAGKTYDSLRFIVTDSRSGLTMTPETTCELVELHGLEELPTEGLVAYYPFNGNANDESGSGNDGIVEGTTLTADRFGHPNSAYAFNGQTDYIVSSRTNSLETDYTVSLWFNHIESNGILFHRGRSNECEYEPRLAVEYQVLHGMVSGCGGGGRFGAVDVAPSAWHHVVEIVRGRSQELYIDGQLVATGNKTPASISSRFFIGVGTPDGSNPGVATSFFHGIIDDVRVYNRALSETEVQALYHEGDWEAEPISSEELEVPFSGGPNAVTTQNSYSGRVLITVSGTGRAAGRQLSDAFYLFTDEQGNTTAPRHPTDRYNWLLWINGAHAERFIVGGQVPDYREDHVYTFEIEAPGGPLTFGIGDIGGRDNQGSYQVRIQRIP